MNKQELISKAKALGTLWLVCNLIGSLIGIPAFTIFAIEGHKANFLPFTAIATIGMMGLAVQAIAYTVAIYIINK